MSVVRRRTTAPPAAVFAVLADGWRYADWVVGAERIRRVADDWPAPGSRFHHEVGVGPLKIKDSSVCDAVDPGHAISLEVKAWPAGTARVRLVLEPTDDGGTEIVFEERPLHGLARTLDNPVLRFLLTLRNVESLRRLARIAEKGVRQPA